MRIKVHCQNRIGILRDILNLLVEYGINVARGEVGGCLLYTSDAADE